MTIKEFTAEILASPEKVRFALWYDHQCRQLLDWAMVVVGRIKSSNK